MSYRDDDSGLSVVLWAERVREAQGEAAVPFTPTLPTTRDMARSSRKRAVRAVTEDPRAMRTQVRRKLPVVVDDLPDRPKSRAECLGTERPCPFVSCRHHLYLDVDRRTGAVKFNFPDLEVWELPDSCALDVAERGGIPGSGQGEGVTLEEIAVVMNLTRERVRQLEVDGLWHVQRADRARGGALAQHAEDEGLGTLRGRRVESVVDPDDGEEDDDVG